MNVYEKLLSVQQELKAPKGQFNSFGKYKYRSCEDILEAVKPILGKHKAVLTITDCINLIGDRYYVIATASFIDPETGDSIQATAQAREEESKKGMDSSQVTGASSSYARKYALNGLFCIDDTKDSDATNTGPKNTDTSGESYFCSDCKIQISPTLKRDGDTWEPKEIAAYSTRRFGRALCPDCQKAAFKAEANS